MEEGVIWDKIWRYEIEHQKIHGVSEFAKQIIRDEILSPGAAILCLGSGQGFDDLYFALNGYQVTASDLSQVAVDHINHQASAQQLTSNLRARVLDMRKLFPFEDEALNAVYAHRSLHYFSDEEMEGILTEAARTLVPDGPFLMQVRSVFDWKFLRADPIEKDTILDFRGLKVRFFTGKSLCSLLEPRFTIERLERKQMEGYGEPTMDLFEVYARKN